MESEYGADVGHKNLQKIPVLSLHSVLFFTTGAIFVLPELSNIAPYSVKFRQQHHLNLLDYPFNAGRIMRPSNTHRRCLNVPGVVAATGGDDGGGYLSPLKILIFPFSAC
jgi:hypothetical protein